MTHIFVNLKRFDIPLKQGGLCPSEHADEWVKDAIRRSAESGTASHNDVEVVFLLPEGLLIPAAAETGRAKTRSRNLTLQIGCQGVYREDVRSGGNFGAFTSSLPATAARNLGAEWAIIGHSEERTAKFDTMAAFDSDIVSDYALRARARAAVDRILNAEVLRCIEAGLDVLFCIGETEDEQVKLEETLTEQLRRGLAGVAPLTPGRRVVIGYEPVWAIGPGKSPPGGEYIHRAGTIIKRAAREITGVDLPVVYGGGLKEANAAEIAAVSTVDGGLVALTRFTEPVGFDPDDLGKIVDIYLSAAGEEGEH